MFISPAFAQATTEAAAAPSGSMSSMIIQLVLIFVIFYLLLIRPQQKRIKEHERQVNALKKGDKLITGGGIFATVTEVDAENNELKVEIAQGVTVRIARPTVRDVISSDLTKEENNNKKQKSKK
jgi:preprotein translocase subunit YajC